MFGMFFRSVLPGFFWLAAVSASALEPGSSWESFGRGQGLSGSSVTAIVQDRTGYLWLATQSGLNRWDGYTMRVWQKQPFSRNSLSHNLIQTMMLDRGEVLWLGTYGGLDRFDITTETFRAFRHEEGNGASLSHNVVTRVFRDSKGVLWIGTLDGLNRMDEKSGWFRVYPFVEGSAEGLAGKTVRTMADDAGGRMWVGSSGGLNLYDADRDRLLRFGEVFPGKTFPAGAVMASYRKPGDRFLWFAVWGAGLVRLDPQTGDFQVHRLGDDRLFGLSADQDGDLLAGTWGGGLEVYRPSTGQTFAFRHDAADPASLAHDVVYGAFEDRSGLVWVATNGGAVSRYNPRQKQFQYTPQGGKVPVLHQGADGSLWAAVYNAGVTRTSPGGRVSVWKHGADPRSLSNDIINGITEDPRGRLWLMTNLGVSILDPASGGVTRWSTDPSRPENLPDEVIDSLAIDRQGRYWFGTYRAGVVRRPEPGTEGPVRHYLADPGTPGALPDNLVYFVQEDRKGRIWVGTNGGLALYRPATDDFQVWTYDPENPKGLPSNTVRRLLEDREGRIWVVTNGGGLTLLDPAASTLENFGLQEGLTNLSVYSVEQDQAGLLWISSANGLFSFRPETRTFHRYGSADGLASPEFSSGSAALRDGRIAFGALQGTVTLTPERMAGREPPPPVALTAVQVLNDSRPVTPALRLGWQENTVTFSFSVLDFRNPAKNTYAYRLDGFDRDWVAADTRHEATYTNLWPGTYTFRVRGANPAEVWSDADQTVTVTVDAAPWASWYAWLVYSGLLLALIYLYQRARVSRSLAQKVAELEVLRTQLEEANTRLDQLARLDGLTGIPNRRALDAWLGEEWGRAHRQRQSVAVLMIDIDDFKRYNDFYGHLAGDSCLKTVAATLTVHLHRNSDFCARFGGEEFVILLHDTDTEGARIVAQRVVEAVDALGIPHQMASAADHVTISVGIAAQIPGPEHTASDLLQKADQALYRAKALGRHRVETA